MAFDERARELRKRLDEYAGPEVGTVDDATARGREQRAVREVIDRYAARRSMHFDRISKVLAGTDCEKTWAREVADARASVAATLGDALHDVTTPSVLGLNIVTIAVDQDLKVYDALAATSSAGAAIDAVARYKTELTQKSDALQAKWARSAQEAEAVMRTEDDVLDEVVAITTAAIRTAADGHRTLREQFRAWLKLTADLGSGIATLAPSAMPPVTAILSKAKDLTDMWDRLAGDLAARKARYAQYFSNDQTSLLIMFKGARDDARAFVADHDYTKLVMTWTATARKALADAGAACVTAGQRADVEALTAAAGKQLDEAERAAKDQWDGFVKANQEKFFGAFSPDLDHALVGSDRLDARYRKVASLDVQGLLERWVGDTSRDWRELDVTEMPEAWHGELRASLLASLDRLAKTEHELAANNSADVLMTWIVANAKDALGRVTG